MLKQDSLFKIESEFLEMELHLPKENNGLKEEKL